VRSHLMSRVSGWLVYSTSRSNAMNLKRHVRELPDLPEPGVRFGTGVAMGLRSLLPDKLRVVHAQAAAALGILSLVAVSACGDEPSSPEPFTPTPAPPQEQALRDVPFAQVVQGSFGAQGLTERETALEAADGSWYRQMGRLIGHLNSPDSLTSAVFIGPRPSGPGGRPEGVYVAFVSVDAGGGPSYDDPAVLTSSRAGIVAEAGDVEPFRQSAESLEGVTSISPRLVLDLEGDGLEEMALLVRTRRQGVSFEHYDVYEREADGEDWRRVGGEGAVDAPGLAALEYWASVGAASEIASRWEPEERLLTVWPWLAEEDAPLDPEVITGLVPDDDPEKVAAAQEALIFLRTFFDEAHQRFSEDFHVRQPWPGFVNGFKSTEAVDLISVSPPAFEEDGTASVDVLLDLTQREGEKPVVRRFLVETETVQEGAEWYLSGVSTSEQRD